MALSTETDSTTDTTNTDNTPAYPKWAPVSSQVPETPFFSLSQKPENGPRAILLLFESAANGEKQ